MDKTIRQRWLQVQRDYQDPEHKHVRRDTALHILGVLSARPDVDLAFSPLVLAARAQALADALLDHLEEAA